VLSYKVGKTFTGDVLFDIQDPAYKAFTKTQRYDEFGNISLAAPWAIKGMAEQILISKSMHFRLPENVILTAKEQCTTDCIIIKTGDAMRSATSNYGNILSPACRNMIPRQIRAGKFLSR